MKLTVNEKHDAIGMIFLDVGNTLRILIKDKEHQTRAWNRILTLVGVDQDQENFCKGLESSYEIYRKWAFETLNEVSEHELWTRWLLPDFPPEKIAPIVGELTTQFRQTTGRRVLQSDAIDVLEELTKRGYLLGIISNVITRNEIPDWLKNEGLEKYFRVVVLSSVLGRRKPSPDIFDEAVRLAGLKSQNCAYIGDNPSRDIEGARKAGFGMVVLLKEGEGQLIDDSRIDNQPDFIIQKFNELLNIFPIR
jgi:HAD superfamily hydrolase (TIGR01549 family)